MSRLYLCLVLNRLLEPHGIAQAHNRSTLIHYYSRPTNASVYDYTYPIGLGIVHSTDLSVFSRFFTDGFFITSYKLPSSLSSHLHTYNLLVFGIEKDMVQWLERGALPMSLPAARFLIPLGAGFSE